MYAAVTIAAVSVLLLVGAQGCATVPAPSPVPYSEPVLSLDTAPVPLPPYRSVVEIVQHNDVGMPERTRLDTVDLVWDGYPATTTWTRRAGEYERPWPKDRYLVREVGRVER
jgi:hypothetical protein